MTKNKKGRLSDKELEQVAGGLSMDISNSGITSLSWGGPDPSLSQSDNSPDDSFEDDSSDAKRRALESLGIFAKGVDRTTPADLTDAASDASSFNIGSITLPKHEKSHYDGNGLVDLHTADGRSDFVKLWDDFQNAKKAGATKGELVIDGTVLNGVQARQRMRETVYGAYMETGNRLLDNQKLISSGIQGNELNAALAKRLALIKELDDIDAIQRHILVSDGGQDKVWKNNPKQFAALFPGLKGVKNPDVLREGVASVRATPPLNVAQALPMFKALSQAADKSSDDYKERFNALAKLVDANTLSDIAYQMGVFDPTSNDGVPNQPFNAKSSQHTTNVLLEMASSEKKHLAMLENIDSALSDPKLLSRFNKQDRAFLNRFAQLNREGIDISHRLYDNFNSLPFGQYNTLKERYDQLSKAGDLSPDETAEKAALEADLAKLNAEMTKQSLEVMTDPAFVRMGGIMGQITSMTAEFQKIKDRNQAVLDKYKASLDKQSPAFIALRDTGSGSFFIPYAQRGPRYVLLTKDLLSKDSNIAGATNAALFANQMAKKASEQADANAAN